MSPFLEEVNFHGSPATLTGQVTELEGLLQKEKKGSHEAQLMLEVSSSSAHEVAKELEKEKTTHSKELEAF